MCPLATHIGAELYVAWKPDIYFNCAYYFTYAPTFGADGKMVESICANVYVDLKQKGDACFFFFLFKIMLVIWWHPVCLDSESFFYCMLCFSMYNATLGAVLRARLSYCFWAFTTSPKRQPFQNTKQRQFHAAVLYKNCFCSQSPHPPLQAKIGHNA